MTGVAVIGSGAFGTSLALALAAEGSPIEFWGRDRDDLRQMQENRKTGTRLPGFDLPESISVKPDLEKISAQVCLLSVPMQKLAGFLESAPSLKGRTLVACCKGVDLKTGLGPVSTIQTVFPDNSAGILTGPSFAVDIAAGLPTALVIAHGDASVAASLQAELNRSKLRLYRTTDTVGAELGGSLKNVVALASGIAIGAGLGESARASVIARGFAEMTRYAMRMGAQPETLGGLSGLGDLVLTATSEKSRNYSAGIAI